MSKPRIVIIEDNPADVRLLRQALDEHATNYALEVLTDGESAIRFLREQCTEHHDPCLIVLDLHLPRYDGLAVLREIRQTPTLAKVKVAVLTTVASPIEEAEMLKLGTTYYARKPTDLDQFLNLGRVLIELCTDGLATAAAQRS